MSDFACVVLGCSLGMAFAAAVVVMFWRDELRERAWAARAAASTKAIDDAFHGEWLERQRRDYEDAVLMLRARQPQVDDQLRRAWGVREWRIDSENFDDVIARARKAART